MPLPGAPCSGTVAQKSGINIMKQVSHALLHSSCPPPLRTYNETQITWTTKSCQHTHSCQHVCLCPMLLVGHEQSCRAKLPSCARARSSIATMPTVAQGTQSLPNCNSPLKCNKKLSLKMHANKQSLHIACVVVQASPWSLVAAHVLGYRQREECGRKRARHKNTPATRRQHNLGPARVPAYEAAKVLAPL